LQISDDSLPASVTSVCVILSVGGLGLRGLRAVNYASLVCWEAKLGSPRNEATGSVRLSRARMQWMLCRGQDSTGSCRDVIEGERRASSSTNCWTKWSLWGFRRLYDWRSLSVERMTVVCLVVCVKPTGRLQVYGVERAVALRTTGHEHRRAAARAQRRATGSQNDDLICQRVRCAADGLLKVREGQMKTCLWEVVEQVPLCVRLIVRRRRDHLPPQQRQYQFQLTVSS
jgi:hypothetical protein